MTLALESPPTEPALLRLHAVSKSFRRGGAASGTEVLRVLHRVSLSLHRRRILALVGESGSGKSTVSKVIARLVDPDEGELVLDGVDVLRAHPRRVPLAYRARVRLIFQDPFASFNPAHTIRHHLERPLVRHGPKRSRAARTEEIERLLDEVGLSPAEAYLHKRPSELSGGQRQRVAIARALAAGPDILLADEPTSMLDVSLRMGVLNLMERLRTERGLAMLLVTHDLASARYVADEIAVMYAGEIVELAPAAELVDDPRHPYTRLLLASVPDGASRFSEAPVRPRAGARKAERAALGCSFAPRCAHATSRCRAESPAAHDVAPGHLVRCHLARDNQEPMEAAS